MKKSNKKIDYSENYKFYKLVIFFFVFSFIGWIWEVLYHVVFYDEIVNRGFLHGPWLPIYGFGITAILVLLKKFRKNKFAEVGAMIIICGLLEYFTSYVLEILFHRRWWDYSNNVLNLEGRVCLYGLLVFAIGGFLVVYYFAPLISKLLNKISKNKLIFISIILSVLFIFDFIYSYIKPNTNIGVVGNTKLIAKEVIYDSNNIITNIFTY